MPRTRHTSSRSSLSARERVIVSVVILLAGLFALSYLHIDQGCVVLGIPGYCHGVTFTATVAGYEVRQRSDIEARDGLVELRSGGSLLGNQCWAKAIAKDRRRNETLVLDQLTRLYPLGQARTVFKTCKRCSALCFFDALPVQYDDEMAALIIFLWVLCIIGCVSLIMTYDVVQRTLKLRKKGECAAYKPKVSVWDIEVGAVEINDLFRREEERKTELEGNRQVPNK